MIGVSADGQESPKPQASIDQSQAYALQPGDELEVSIWGDQSASRQTIVAPDGMISYPLIGQIKAAGKTIPALEKEFSKRLSKNYKTPPQVTITLTSVREGSGSQVFITGEVNKPGPYPLTPGLSVMQAITMSGGFGRFAAKSRVQIHRRVGGAEQVLLFDYSDFLSGNNPASDVVLQAGDVIVVPERGLFF
jgi:polysaccharide biosynthesis/export protein